MRVVRSAMRARFGTVFLVTGLFGGFAAAACSSSPGAVGASLDGGDTGGDSPVGPTPGRDAGDSGAESAADAAPAPPQTYLRIGNVSPDLPPLDVCVAPHGTSAF